MSHKINTDELKAMIANKVKEIGLNDILDETAMEKIKGKIMNTYNLEKAKAEVPEIIPEASSPTIEQGVFPSGGFGTGVGESTGATVSNATSIETIHIPDDLTQTPGQNVDAGSTGNIIAYKPELPSFIDKIEPAKIIVFSQNELSEGGENLSNKPLRTYENPDIKKSMNDFWLDKGQKKAEVYMVKLEKIGELDFNYANGTTQFNEKRFDPDFEAQAKYKENPYMADNAGPATPGALDINGQSNIVNQIASSIDLKQVVTDLVMNILRDQLLTNTTKAVNASEFNSPSVYSIDTNTSIAEGFNTKMIDLVNSFSKIDSPKELKEAIDKSDKSCLIKENEEVQEWKVNGKYYYTPVNKISTKKCYIKA